MRGLWKTLRDAKVVIYQISERRTNKIMNNSVVLKKILFIVIT